MWKKLKGAPPFIFIPLAYLVQLCDDVPYIRVHPDWEQDNSGYLTEHQQQPQVVDTDIMKTLKMRIILKISHQPLDHF